LFSSMAFSLAFKSLTVLTVENLSATSDKIKSFAVLR
jgi:hypothetical protein